MQVTLSYTIKEEDILGEAASLLGLRGPALQKVIDDFQKVQAELKQEDDSVNVSRAEELLSSLRAGLREVDQRAAEVGTIIQEYEFHRRQALAAPPPEDPPAAKEVGEKE